MFFEITQCFLNKLYLDNLHSNTCVKSRENPSVVKAFPRELQRKKTHRGGNFTYWFWRSVYFGPKRLTISSNCV